MSWRPGLRGAFLPHESDVVDLLDGYAKWFAVTGMRQMVWYYYD